ncbi:MAG: DNA-deoxyinosine glycosylase [Proteobacteria bacterium]|nr:DNA-deoxyinosine glycosylase [Pseudomonadota bacterium]NOG60549.1 DNA-deoxyinosine glycosylase [Pseudomonadota bacterium]
MTDNTGFPPIVNQEATILILGSMPGQKSLEKQQYYAHPRNSFWPIIYQLFNVDKKLNYEQCKKLLLSNNIALWDVLRSCYRAGSLDSNIDHSSIETNDFKSFFIKYPGIKHVFFNGAKAELLFKNEVLKYMINSDGLSCHKLPSTSPAHASMSYEEKLKKWKLIKNVDSTTG